MQVNKLVEYDRILHHAVWNSRYCLYRPWFLDRFYNFPHIRCLCQLSTDNTFGKKGGLEHALRVTKIVVDKIKETLESLEIGNDLDLMVRFGHWSEGDSLKE